MSCPLDKTLPVCKICWAGKPMDDPYVYGTVKPVIWVCDYPFCGKTNLMKLKKEYQKNINMSCRQVN